MTLSASIPKTPRLLAERHTDPRGLWIVAILISVALHLMLGWAIVRLLLGEGKPTAQSKQELIPIEAVAIAPTPQPSPSPFNAKKASSATVPAPTESPSTPAQAPTPTRDRADSKSKSWRWFRPGARGQSPQPTVVSAETPTTESSNSPQRTSQQRTRANVQRRVSAANGEPIWNDSAASPNSNYARASSRTGTQRRVSAANGEPIGNDSAASSRSRSGASKGSGRRFSGSGAESLWDDSSPASGSSSSAAQSGDRSKSQSGSPSSSSKTPPSSPPASNTAQNRGVTASLGTPRLTLPDRDVPDKLATPRQSSQQLSVLPLGVQLSGSVVLETIAIIEPDGNATVLQTNVLSGAIDSQQAEQLAKSIVEGWSFNPTLMAGQAVAQEYFIQLTLSPIAP